jgi:hypothetical protein
VTNTPGYGRGTSQSKEPFRLAGSTPSSQTVPRDGSIRKPFLASQHDQGSVSASRMSPSSQQHGRQPRNELMPYHVPSISPPSQQQQPPNESLHPNERIPRNELLPYHNPGQVFADYDTPSDHAQNIYNPIQEDNEMDYLHHPPTYSQQQRSSPHSHHKQQPQLQAYSQDYPSLQIPQRQIYSSQQMSPTYPSQRDNPPIAVIPQRGIAPSSASQYNRTSTSQHSSAGLPYARTSTSQINRNSSNLQSSAGATYHRPPHVRPTKMGSTRAGTAMASGMVSGSGGFGARPIGTPAKNRYPPPKNGTIV